MYLPLEYAKKVDIELIPYAVGWRQTIQKFFEQYFDDLPELWLSEDILNKKYKGPIQFVNDQLIQNRRSLYSAVTGKADIPSDSNQDIALAREVLSIFLVMNKWLKDKEVYCFDAKLEEALADSEEIKLPIRVLDRLPYRNFFIEFAKDGIFASNFMGAYIQVIPYKTGYFILFQRIKETGESMFGSVCLAPEDDSDATFIFLKGNVTAENQCDRNRDWQKFGLFALNSILYLCAANAEISENPVTKNTYRPTKTVRNKFSEVRKWDCGYRFGSEVRKMTNINSKENKAEEPDLCGERDSQIHRSPVAHTRRAHWHHYWTGPRKGERQLILKWIAPTYVCGQTKVAIIHKCQKGS